MSDLPYGRQLIEADDIAAVCEVLQGDWLTTGPAVERFERALADYIGARHAICCNSGTAALYLAVRALGLEPGDAVIVPAVTFLATASAPVLAGLGVLFADVDPNTGLMSAAHADASLERASGLRVRGVLPVYLGGQVGDPIGMRTFAEANDLVVIEDACHALGSRYGNARSSVGGCRHSDVACFSFHPVKTITMGEGGALTTNDEQVAARARLLRSHGMTRDQNLLTNDELARSKDGAVNPWYYEAHEISHNFRASDINCALGLSQLKKVDRFLARRRELVARYRERLATLAPYVRPVPDASTPDAEIGWHLFAVLVDFPAIGMDRRAFMRRLSEKGVMTQVHYIPVHLQPYYRSNYSTPYLPGAMAYYERTLSLPLFAGMTVDDVDRVVDTIEQVIRR